MSSDENAWRDQQATRHRWRNAMGDRIVERTAGLPMAWIVNILLALVLWAALSALFYWVLLRWE
jgi:hypothetical protein